MQINFKLFGWQFTSQSALLKNWKFETHLKTSIASTTFGIADFPNCQLTPQKSVSSSGSLFVGTRSWKFRSLPEMNCPTVYSEEACKTPCEVKDCTDEHLTSFCPPICQKCTPCVSDCLPCVSPCDLSACCITSCDSSAISSKRTKACHNRYELLKHVNRCPPKPSCLSRCQRSRPSYKPVVKCMVAGLPCYETIYMRAFNTPQACCPDTCEVSCCSLGC